MMRANAIIAPTAGSLKHSWKNRLITLPFVRHPGRNDES